MEYKSGNNGIKILNNNWHIIKPCINDGEFYNIASFSPFSSILSSALPNTLTTKSTTTTTATATTTISAKKTFWQDEIDEFHITETAGKFKTITFTKKKEEKIYMFEKLFIQFVYDLKLNHKTLSLESRNKFVYTIYCINKIYDNPLHYMSNYFFGNKLLDFQEINYKTIWTFEYAIDFPDVIYSLLSLAPKRFENIHDKDEILNEILSSCMNRKNIENFHKKISLHKFNVGTGLLYYTLLNLNNVAILKFIKLLTFILYLRTDSMPPHDLFSNLGIDSDSISLHGNTVTIINEDEYLYLNRYGLYFMLIKCEKILKNIYNTGLSQQVSTYFHDYYKLFVDNQKKIYGKFNVMTLEKLYLDINMNNFNFDETNFYIGNNISIWNKYASKIINENNLRNVDENDGIVELPFHDIPSGKDIKLKYKINDFSILKKDIEQYSQNIKLSENEYFNVFQPMTIIPFECFAIFTKEIRNLLYKKDFLSSFVLCSLFEDYDSFNSYSKTLVDDYIFKDSQLSCDVNGYLQLISKTNENLILKQIKFYEPFASIMNINENDVIEVFLTDIDIKFYKQHVKSIKINLTCTEMGTILYLFLIAGWNTKYKLGNEIIKTNFVDGFFSKYQSLNLLQYNDDGQITFGTIIYPYSCHHAMFQYLSFPANLKFLSDLGLPSSMIRDLIKEWNLHDMPWLATSYNLNENSWNSHKAMEHVPLYKTMHRANVSFSIEEDFKLQDPYHSNLLYDKFKIKNYEFGTWIPVGPFPSHYFSTILQLFKIIKAKELKLENYVKKIPKNIQHMYDKKTILQLVNDNLIFSDTRIWYDIISAINRMEFQDMSIDEKKNRKRKLDSDCQLNIALAIFASFATVGGLCLNSFLIKKLYKKNE
ncbi:hypothetical protein PV326_004475 [Microctonus aethiopoides]|nr:hypothetical protein PV326_004475 [Microctonus aethiopoides]